MSKTKRKQRTTIYISPEVLTFLKMKRAQGQGSVSQQLEDLAKSLMPKTYSKKDLKFIEQHALGYAKAPVAKDEFEDVYAEQDLSEV